MGGTLSRAAAGLLNSENGQGQGNNKAVIIDVTMLVT
jgi:hypothetical protein